jgi:hypothetical protein
MLMERPKGVACVGDERTKDQQHSLEEVCMSVSRRLRARTGMLAMAALSILAATPASAADGTGIGSGRLIPGIAAVVGLIGVILGWMAVARSAGRIGTGDGRGGAIAAGVAGLISVVVGGLHAANSAGGFGTGNGLAGAIVDIVVGLIGMVLAGLALARSRRTADG